MSKDKRLSPHKLLGITWVGNDGHTYKFRRRSHPYLRITLTSYSAIGGIHTYARVHGRAPDIYDVEDRRWLACGGHGDNKPSIYGHGFDQDATRVLTEIEYDAGRVTLGEIGEETNRFNTDFDAFKAALDCAVANYRDTNKLHWDVRFEACGQELDDNSWRLSDLIERPDYLLELFGVWDDED